MKDKNIVLLEGVVGNDVKRGVASNGKKYITFSLCINTYFKPLHDSTESEHPISYIRVFIYDQKQVEYLNRVKIKQGNRASIFGRLNSTRNEIKGKEIIQINVIVRDISITKVKADMIDEESNNNNNENKE